MNSEVPSGEGRVYKCLKKHKDEETMSDEVRTVYSYHKVR